MRVAKIPGVLRYNKEASIAGEAITRKSKARKEDGREPNNVEVYKSLKNSEFLF